MRQPFPQRISAWVVQAAEKHIKMLALLYSLKPRSSSAIIAAGCLSLARPQTHSSTSAAVPPVNSPGNKAELWPKYVAGAV